MRRARWATATARIRRARVATDRQVPESECVSQASTVATTVTKMVTAIRPALVTSASMESALQPAATDATIPRSVLTRPAGIACLLVSIATTDTAKRGNVVSLAKGTEIAAVAVFASTASAKLSAERRASETQTVLMIAVHVRVASVGFSNAKRLVMRIPNALHILTPARGARSASTVSALLDAE